MADPEIVVEVTVPGEGETPSIESAAPVVIVADPASAGGTDPGTILSLEMLRDQVMETRATLAEFSGRFESHESRFDNHSERIKALETAEVIEAEDEGEIVAETIPAAPVVEVAAEVQPVARKRRFIGG